MRLGIFIAAGLCVVGGVLAYFLYGQLHTETILIAAKAQAYAGPDGAPCETMAFSLEPRQMGQMSVLAEKGQSISGRFVVQGGIEGDVAFRVFTPHGRMVLDEGRNQELDFNVPVRIRGDYVMQFDNRFSILTEKDVELTYCLR
jgi:hypothetical protein